MQNITPPILKGQKIIEKYGDGSFTISGERWQTSIALYPYKVVELEIINNDVMNGLFNYIYQSGDLEEFANAHVVLFGTGDGKINVPIQLSTAFRESNINIETMDTGAACRTYNVLLSEGRKVIAILVKVEGASA